MLMFDYETNWPLHLYKYVLLVLYTVGHKNVPLYFGP